MAIKLRRTQGSDSKLNTELSETTLDVALRATIRMQIFEIMIDAGDVKLLENSERIEKDGKDLLDEGLWDNIHAKRKRGEKPAKPGTKDYPDAKSWKKAQNEDLTQEEWEEANSIFEKAPGWEECQPTLDEAEYQGRKVELNKPMQGDVKKFKVYTKNDKGNVVKVNFGQKGVKIKKDNPERRKSFRARHGCDSPGPKWKAKYWSCSKW